MAGKTGHQEIAARYARAYFALAQESSQIEQIAADLCLLRDALTDCADFVKFLNNATLRRVEEAQVIAALGDKMELSALTKKFLGTLAMNRRLDILPEIVAAAEGAVARHKGEITAYVTSAQTLDAAQVSGIAAMLKKKLDKTVKVDLKQDADIMGGLIIQVSSQRIDSSVRSKLERLHRALKNPGSAGDTTKMREVA